MNNCLILILTLTVLISCDQNDKNEIIETSNTEKENQVPIIKSILVDYKSDSYNISIGDNYKVSEQIIDWQWAGENDVDAKIDSTGKDAFIYLGEPLLNYNNVECLPSLYIETDKNIITAFSCSVLFDLADTNDAETTFLILLSKDIKQLQNKDVINSIITKGFYENKSSDNIETIRLIRGEKYEYDKFEYIIKAISQNNR